MIGRLAGGLAVAGAACVGYGALVENRSFRVRRLQVPVLPPRSPKLRVLHLSDVHLGARNRARAGFLSHLAGLEPDLVVSTGDHISEAGGIELLAESLGRLLERPGVFVTSSNDYTGPSLTNPLAYLWRTTANHGADTGEVPLPTDRLRTALSAGGWQDVTQRRISLDVRGLRLEVRGTDDAHLDLDDYAAVAGRPTAGTDLAIGVTHAPYRRLLDAMTADRVRLILAGHTHGGQVCVPGYGALTTNCDLPTARAKGLSRHRAAGRSSWLHVSAGVGTSPMAPFRFACPPEVSLLTLVPRSNG
ncbi:MAG TPA: metallophosphoesterase [Propionicimonas sp.]|nr:metallophosphoesterase [Propionicimonas sp.]